jgi:HEAT repeat protein
MVEQVDRELLYEILNTLKYGTDGERQKVVLETVPKLHNKQSARDEFILLLNYTTKEDAQGWDSWENPGSEVRGWAATALVLLCGTTDEIARTAVRHRLEKEEDPLPRYWMLDALYRMSDRKEIESVVRGIAEDYSKKTDQDQDDPFEDTWSQNHRAGPLALAILAVWGDREAIENLEGKLKSQNFELMWAVCRALAMVSCREMLSPLQYVAEDQRTWPDIRNKSVKAISLIESPAATQVLGRLLANSRDPILKESIIEGLEHLGQSRLVRDMMKQLGETNKDSYSVADSLMVALMDNNAQIRRRAAEALHKVMVDLKDVEEGLEESYKKALNQARIPAAEKVVGELVRERTDLKEGIPLLVDALRAIDPDGEAAATVLTRYLNSDDLSVKQRAEHALKLVGGEKAVQTLMGQKSEVLKAYNDLLAKADEPIQELFKETMRQAQRSFSTSQGMSVTIFIIGVGVLIAGLYVAFTAGQDGIQRIFGAGTSLVGVIAVLLDLLFRDPHKRVQEATSVLLRIKVIFLGYVRQIHQVDATFKHEFIEGGKEFGISEVKDTVKQITDVMNNTMNMIDLHLPISKNEKLAVDEVLKPWQERLEAALKAGENGDDALAEGEKENAETTDAQPGAVSSTSTGNKPKE